MSALSKMFPGIGIVTRSASLIHTILHAAANAHGWIRPGRDF
jgi:hypothetical protein